MSEITDGRRQEVAAVLKAAWSAVETASLPETLQVAAFNQAVALLTSSGSGGSSLGPKTRGRRGSKEARQPAVDSGQETGSEVAVAPNEDAFFETFASESGVSEEKLRQVYFVKDGRPRIALTKSKLGSSEADRNRAVATLLAGMKWYVESKASVSIGEIRAAAEVIPYEVSRNLATHLDGVAGTIATGAKRDKAVRVQGARFDDVFAALIEKLTAQ